MLESSSRQTPRVAIGLILVPPKILFRPMTDAHESSRVLVDKGQNFRSGVVKFGNHDCFVIAGEYSVNACCKVGCCGSLERPILWCGIPYTI